MTKKKENLECSSGQIISSQFEIGIEIKFPSIDTRNSSFFFPYPSPVGLPPTPTHRRPQLGYSVDTTKLFRTLKFIPIFCHRRRGRCCDEARQKKTRKKQENKMKKRNEKTRRPSSHPRKVIDTQVIFHVSVDMLEGYCA